MSKFKVGDIVEVLTQTNGWGGVKEGDIGTVVSYENRGRYGTHYYVDFPNQKLWGGYEKCFILLEEEN